MPETCERCKAVRRVEGASFARRCGRSSHLRIFWRQHEVRLQENWSAHRLREQSTNPSREEGKPQQMQGFHFLCESNMEHLANRSRARRCLRRTRTRWRKAEGETCEEVGFAGNRVDTHVPYHKILVMKERTESGQQCSIGRLRPMLARGERWRSQGMCSGGAPTARGHHVLDIRHKKETHQARRAAGWRVYYKENRKVRVKPWGEAQGYRGGHEDVPAGQVVGGAAGDHVVSFGAGACFPRGDAGYDIQKYDGMVLQVGHVGCHENIVTAQEACGSDCASCL